MKVQEDKIIVLWSNTRKQAHSWSTHESFKNVSIRIILILDDLKVIQNRPGEKKMVSYNAVPFPDNINLVFSFFFINSLLHTLINLINIKCEIPGNICKPKPQTVQPGVLPKYPPTELSE